MVKKRRQHRIGHVLQTEKEKIPCTAVTWAPEGKRNHTTKRDMEMHSGAGSQTFGHSFHSLWTGSGWKQAVSQDLKSGCPKCAIRSTQMNNNTFIKQHVKNITISSKSGCPQHAWMPTWLKAWLEGMAKKDLAVVGRATVVHDRYQWGELISHPIPHVGRRKLCCWHCWCWCCC